MKLTAIIGIIAVMLGFALIPTSKATSTCETLFVPFTGGPYAATTTLSSYSGTLWVHVSGNGTAAGTQVSDAFYVYTDSWGNLLTGTPGWGTNLPGPWHSPLLYNWVLWINGQDAVSWISGLPSYNPSHEYIFQINVGTPTSLTFGVGDTGTWDNTGNYDVTVSTDPLDAAALHIIPDDIDTSSNGQYITADITLPGTYNINTNPVLWSTVKLEGTIGMVYVGGSSPMTISSTRFRVKFDRSTVNAFLIANSAVSSGYATLTVTFTLTSPATVFASDDFVYVI